MSEGLLEPWYVTGLIEVAGSFTQLSAGRSVTPAFSIKRPALERDLLRGLSIFFGGGNLYQSGGTAQLRIVRNAELLRVVDHFNAYPLRSQKAEAFAVWRQIVELRREFRGERGSDLVTLGERLTQLNGPARRVDKVDPRQ